MLLSCRVLPNTALSAECLESGSSENSAIIIAASCRRCKTLSHGRYANEQMFRVGLIKCPINTRQIVLVAVFKVYSTFEELCRDPHTHTHTHTHSSDGDLIKSRLRSNIIRGISCTPIC